MDSDNKREIGRKAIGEILDHLNDESRAMSARSMRAKADRRADEIEKAYAGAYDTAYTSHDMRVTEREVKDWITLYRNALRIPLNTVERAHTDTCRALLRDLIAKATYNTPERIQAIYELEADEERNAKQPVTAPDGVSIISGQRARIEELERAYAIVQTNSEERRLRIEELEQAKARLGQTIRDQADTIKKLQGTIEHQRQEIGKKAARIETLEYDRDGMRKTIDEMREQLRERNAQLDGVRAAIAEPEERRVPRWGGAEGGQETDHG